MSKAATFPMAKPYPEWTSGSAMLLLDDAGEAGDVGELLDRGEEAADVAAVHVLMELVEHERLEVLVHVEDAGNAHVGNEALAHAHCVGVTRSRNSISWA